MALRQTRRTVSLSRTVYEAAKRAAASAGAPLSRFVEDALTARLIAAPDRRQAFESELAKLRTKWGIDV